ncbi:hypothetical protein [Zhihengliuella sp.]|uniref:hypothetical protein n=1 Tax=Zhihengliuella sp. TaxID=1954483 RepID=UPI0028112AF9|nr:hypothetical protein [Zhihengliuella sp.]
MRGTRSAVLAAAVLLLGLTGCTQVQQATEDAAASAVDSVTESARRDVVARICAPVTDGTLDASDVALLSSLVEPAEAAGVPADLLDPLRRVAEAGDSAPQDLLDEAAAACTETGAGGS